MILHEFNKEDMLQKALLDLGWYELLNHVSMRCSTEQGRTLALQIAPFATVQEAQKRASEIGEAKFLIQVDKALSFGGVIDIEPLLRRVEQGEVLEAFEFLSVARTLRQGSFLKNHLFAYQEQAPLLFAYGHEIWEGDELAFSIENTFTDQGEIKDSASPQLKNLRRQLQSVQSEAQRVAQRLLDQDSLSTALQDRYVTQREGRYVLPIRTEARIGVRGIIQDRSSSGSTVFIEPESLIELNNQIKFTVLELQAEEHRILQKLSYAIFEAQTEIQKNVSLLARLDLIQGSARLALELQATPLFIGSEAQHVEQQPIALYKARHPLLMLKGVQVVPNDILLQKGHTLILSGPNAGGKTVSMKLLGLFSLMSRAGLFCPAQEGSCLPWFDFVFTDIGDEQSLERNLSTFSGHIQNICSFLRQASSQSLFLLDEVAAGTDPEQGAALAQGVLEALASKEATVLVTTHYPSLKQLAFSDSRFSNASVGYDLEKLQPTYRLHLSVPGPSETLPVAKRLGLQESVIDRAKQLLRKEKLEAEAMLHQLMEQREELMVAKQLAELAEKEAKEKSQKLEGLLLQTQAELQKQRRKAHDEAVYALQQARRTLEETKQTLKQKQASGSLTSESVSAAKKQLDQLSSHVFSFTPQKEIPSGSIPEASNLSVGAQVYLTKLSCTGKVLSLAVKDKVWVQAGTLKMQVLLSELRLLTGGAFKQTVEHKKSSVSVQVEENHQRAQHTVAIRTPGNTLDLRGARVEDALLQAENFVNQALQEEESAVFIIHGHGTGALKQAIRTHFLSYPRIQELAPGAPEDGGDGVTILYLE